MFDIATRPSLSSGIASLAVPFDWRLTAPLAAATYPWTAFSTPEGVPQANVDVLATYALALEDTLQTAISLSLFTDARAGDDDVLPLGATDRRGWVGDEFMAESFDSAVDTWGSLFWLLYTGKATADIVQQAKFYGQEALAWMVRNGVASQVVVDALWVPAGDADRLAIRPQIYKADKVKPIYDVLWGTTVRRGASS
jgi:phage gp46-like protein